MSFNIRHLVPGKGSKGKSNCEAEYEYFHIGKVEKPCKNMTNCRSNFDNSITQTNPIFTPI